MKKYPRIDRVELLRIAFDSLGPGPWTGLVHQAWDLETILNRAMAFENFVCGVPVSMEINKAYPLTRTLKHRTSRRKKASK